SVGTGAPAADVSASGVPSPWPANASFRADGMWIAGQSAVALAGRYGTPLLVFDRSDLAARLGWAKRAFPKTFYAVKAFSAHAMLRLAADEGLDLLAASGGEVDAFAGAAGVVQPFLLRVNPGVRVDTHESIATGHESTAFGVPVAEASSTI